MKADLHPEIFPVIYRDANAKTDFFSYSTMSSEETEEHNGQTYYVIRIDVSSASHPFFTGKQNLVDTSGRVERFNARLQRSQ